METTKHADLTGRAFRRVKKIYTDVRSSSGTKDEYTSRIWKRIIDDKAYRIFELGNKIEEIFMSEEPLNIDELIKEFKEQELLRNKIIEIEEEIKDLSHVSSRISTLVTGWNKPIITGHHAHDDQYRAFVVPSAEKLEMVFTPEVGEVIEYEVSTYMGPGVAMGMFNTDESIVKPAIGIVIFHPFITPRYEPSRQKRQKPMCVAKNRRYESSVEISAAA